MWLSSGEKGKKGDSIMIIVESASARGSRFEHARLDFNGRQIQMKLSSTFGVQSVNIFRCLCFQISE